MAAKRKVAKKSARTTRAKAPRAKPKKATKPTRKPARPVKRTTPVAKQAPPKPAGTVEVVKLPLVDVTPQVQENVVPAKAAAVPEAETRPPMQEPEQFQKELTQPPAKRGFWARLFGRH